MSRNGSKSVLAAAPDLEVMVRKRPPHFYKYVRRYWNEHFPQRSIDDKAFLKWSLDMTLRGALSKAVFFPPLPRDLSLVYVDKPQTLDHLEDNIRRVIADIRPQMLEKVIENWTSRLDYIRASRGSPMPEIIFKM
ncbi:hypothetical protein TNCV_4165191 [Trichonephila clavipes]|nr:hypothetical protein TNCV_4165191 [Trichonephila clavipes]